MEQEPVTLRLEGKSPGQVREATSVGAGHGLEASVAMASRKHGYPPGLVGEGWRHVVEVENSC